MIVIIVFISPRNSYPQVQVDSCFCLTFLKRFLRIYFSERGGGRENERERNINVWLPLMHPLLGTWPATRACALTGNLTSTLVVHRPALNPLSHTSKGIILLPNFCFSMDYIYLVLFSLSYLNIIK